MVNNCHNEKHREVITDVVAELAGELLGEPPVGFKSKADRDEILKVAFANTAEGRKFRKRFLEMAQSPGGLADLYTDSASWSHGKAYAEKLCASLVSKRDQIIVAIKSCIRDNGTIDNDKLLTDFGEKTQKQDLMCQREESNQYLKLAMDAESGTEISDEYLLPLIMVKFDFDSFLANDPSTQHAAQHAKSIAKATALIRDDGTSDLDAYSVLDKPTKSGVMNVIRDRCTKYERL